MLCAVKPISSEAALQRLLEGNQRFVEDRLHKVQLGARLKEVAPAQFPFAAILGCSDSRVPAELVFDCSLGDLFVVRTAGHVLGPEVTGSLNSPPHTCTSRSSWCSATPAAARSRLR